MVNNKVKIRKAQNMTFKALLQKCQTYNIRKNGEINLYILLTKL